MKRYSGVVQDVSGNVLSGITVNVYTPVGTTTSATIYSDDGVTPVANPVTTDANGRYFFYAKDGKYDLKFSGSGLTTYTESDIEIADVTEYNATTDNSIWQTGKLRTGDGSAASPSLSFVSDPTTGISRFGGILTFSVSGSAYWNISASGQLQPQSNGSYDIGSAGLRVSNLYVNTIPNGATLTTPTINSPTIATPNITGIAVLAGATFSSTISSYNGLATTGTGVPSVVAVVDLTSQTAAQGSTTLYAVTVAGQYRLHWNAKVTTAAGTSSTLGPLTVTYTDPDGVNQSPVAAAQITAGTISTSSTANTTNALLLGMPLLLNCKAATNITFTFGYAAVAANAMNYNLHIRLEAI